MRLLSLTAPATVSLSLQAGAINVRFNISDKRRKWEPVRGFVFQLEESQVTTLLYTERSGMTWLTERRIFLTSLFTTQFTITTDLQDLNLIYRG